MSPISTFIFLKLFKRFSLLRGGEGALYIGLCCTIMMFTANSNNLTGLSSLQQTKLLAPSQQPKFTTPYSSTNTKHTIPSL